MRLHPAALRALKSRQLLGKPMIAQILPPSDQFIHGRRFQILAIVDDCTRENLALVADISRRAFRVSALILD